MSKSISSRLQETPRMIEAYFGDYSFLFSIVLGPHLIIYILADSFSPTFFKVYFHHPTVSRRHRAEYKLGIYLFFLTIDVTKYIIITFYILVSIHPT
jgi:hypothetical protein